MKTVRSLVCLLLMASSTIRAADDVLDALDERLTWAADDGRARARLSGTLDLEGYALPQPAPGFIDAEGSDLFNPRLSFYLDVQAGEHLYAFAQARVDRGFDPAAEPIGARLDEYAVRWSPGVKRAFEVQVGRFATVVGNWTGRHDSWTNPFITAPLPYENLTGVWDNEPVHSVGQLLAWSHVRGGVGPEQRADEKYVRLPVIWGPSYATGVAIAGQLGAWRYAFELKNAALSSRPESWGAHRADWDAPTISGRLRYVPSEQWELGWSASSGSFLRPSAERLLPNGVGRGRYRETVLGQDVTYAWHHLQVWGEVYAARFEMPIVGQADTLSYYLESRYRFTARWSTALRWNQQLFGTVNLGPTAWKWGHDVWRIDFAPALRLTAHAQVKVQYSLQHGDQDAQHLTQMLAGQFTVRF